MNFNATYAGRVYALTGGTLYDYIDGLFKGISVSAAFDNEVVTNGYRVALTGYSETSSRGNVGYQTTSGRYILLSEGWQYVGDAPISQYSQTQAQKLVDKIIKNNIVIVQNNLVCARFANKFTAAQQQQIRELQRRCEARKSALVSQGLCTNVQTSYPKGYADLGAYLDALMAGESIGIASWVVVVIVAVVIAGLGTAAYFGYKALADESADDVKYSKELMSVLTSKLTEEEYQQLLDETQGIVTKAKLKTLFFGSPKLWLGLAIAGFAFYYYKQMRKNSAQ